MKHFAIVLVLTPLLFASTAPAQVPVSDYFSTDSQLNGHSLQPGTTIEAWDSDGVRCGFTQVGMDASFRAHIWGDDVQTPAVDEGAMPGEFVAWRINGLDIAAADALWIASITGSFDDARWEDGAAKQIRLAAYTTTAQPRSWSVMKELYRP